MFKAITYFISVIILASITEVFAKSLRIHNVSPDLLLIYTLMFAYEENLVVVILLSFFSGLYVDFLLGVPVGSATTAIILIAIFTKMLAGRFAFFYRIWWRMPFLVSISTVFLYIFIYFCTYILSTLHIGSVTINTKLLISRLPWLIGYNLAVTYLVYSFYKMVRLIQEMSERKKKSGVGL